MKLTIAGQTYDLDVREITNGEAIALEKATGLSYFDWLRSVLNRPSMQDATALVWLLKRRSDPALLFDEVQFTTGDWLDRDEDWTSPEATEGNPVAPSTSTG